MESSIGHLNVESSSSDFEEYMDRFEIWCMTRKDIKDDKIPAHFLTFIGKDAYSLLKNLAYPEKPISLPYEKLKELLLEHVKTGNFECRERAQYHKLMRQEGQKIKDFILVLQVQASKCNFGDQLNVQLRDRLIAGINLPALEKELIQLPKPTFQDVKAACINYEAVHSLAVDSPQISSTLMSRPKQMHCQGHIQTRHFNDRFISRASNPTKVDANHFPNNHGEFKLGKCLSCGKIHPRNTCPFRSSKCFKCGKIGHLKSVCRSSTYFMQACNSNTGSSSDNFTLATNSDQSFHMRERIYTARGRHHDFILDTGSIQSIISVDSLRQLEPNAVVKPSSISVKGITGHELPICGCCDLQLRFKNHDPVSCEFLVSRYGPSILGLNAMRMLKMELSLLTVNENPTTHTLRDLLVACSRVRGGINMQPVHLEVTGEPIFLKRRLLPYGLQESVKKVIDDLVSKGILTAVESSVWATPIVTPLKADGRTPRICGDYRVTLNTRLLQRTCTTVEPEDILNKLCGSKYFSKIDLKDAYLQIPLDNESSELTTINTPFGLYRYNYLPFGLSVSPAIFQNAMNNITAGMSGIEVYQDDIIIHAPTKESHDSKLLELFQRLKSKNVAVNPSKCQIAVTNMKCLGYLIDASGFKPDPDRLSPLVNVQSPKCLTELRSLLGALQYYSRFIPNFAMQAKPLFDILSETSFKWSNVAEKVLRDILKFLKVKALLRPFSPTKHSHLITDASPIGIGAVLEQDGYPIICISRKLSAAEQGYAQTQREALAVYWAVKRLHKYLFGHRFTIITDHEALKFIYHPDKSLARSSAAMVQRWSIALSAYNYTIEHRSAKQIQHVDYVSRHSLQFQPSSTSDCLLVQPFPVNRFQLIRDTRRYFGAILSAIRKGWNSRLKRLFPVFYSRREELSVTVDGILCLNDRIVVPPTLRKAVLDDLHSGHLGIEKMKSLARMTCWWPEIDADIRAKAMRCENCHHKVHNQPSKWTPWPLSTEVWQRVHADYCGPFLGKYYGLVIMDSYSKWPEVFFTTSANSDFTITALRKVFSREGVPVVLVTDNGTHFTADNVSQWLKGIGCRHLFSAPRHPSSNGQAENFVKTLKSAISSMDAKSFHELDRGVDNFLLQYRNAVHSTTKESPAKLFKCRNLRSSLRCLNSAEVQYFRGNDIRPSTGVVLQNMGKSMIRIMDLDDLSVHNRHLDQIRFQEQAEIERDAAIQSDDDDPPEQNAEIGNTRHSERLQSKPRLNYRNSEFHSRCGGCGDC